MQGLPPQYLYVLKCCLAEDCPHPLCKSSQPVKDLNWFPGGPSIDWIPIPIPDLKRPWGCSKCDSCTGFCSGHFLSPEEAVTSSDPPMSQETNPSKTWLIVKDEFYDRAVDAFATTGIGITSSGKRHLGAAIGKRSFVDEYVTQKSTGVGGSSSSPFCHCQNTASCSICCLYPWLDQSVDLLSSDHTGH